MTRRYLAIALASVVAAVFQAAHSLAYAGTVDVAGVAFELGATALTLVVLTAAGWSLWRSAVLALGLGELLAFAVLHAHPPRIVAQVGAFDGLLRLGLWALAVLVPDARRRRLEAERERLRAHLQPHFLLNTLNTIAGLVTAEPQQARELIAALADLLRDSLASEETHAIADEIAWLQRYAEIVAARHPGLTFRWDIAEATLGVHVPRLLLQPLVENAIQHGALRRHEGGEVHVRTERANGRVTCVVEDNGPGPSEPRDGALGLELVTRRLELEGKGQFRLERAGELTRSIVELPS